MTKQEIYNEVKRLEIENSNVLGKMQYDIKKLSLLRILNIEFKHRELHKNYSKDIHIKHLKLELFINEIAKGVKEN